MENPSKNELLVHARTKHDGKMYSCNMCGTQFRMRDSLLHHQLRAHHMEPVGCKIYSCKVESCVYR